MDLYRGYDEGLLDEDPTRFSDMYPAAATGLLGAGMAREERPQPAEGIL